MNFQGIFSLSVGDFEITVNISSGDSLNDVASAINIAVQEKASEEDIRNPLSAKIMDNTLILTSNETGEDYKISTTDDDGILLDLGVLDETGNLARELQTAHDAIIKVDGLEISRSSNTIDDLIKGLTLDITGKGVCVCRRGA